jgi:hypothetical protein
MWGHFSLIEFDPRRLSGFLGDDQYVYSPPPLAGVNIEAAGELLEPERKIFYGEEISGKEPRDDTNDYQGYRCLHGGEGQDRGHARPATVGDMPKSQ